MKNLYFEGMLMTKFSLIRYFFIGEEIAFYFAWMSYFRWALCIPSVFGIFVYFWRNPGITVDDNFLLPLYALFMVIWAVFFIVVGLNIFLYKYIKYGALV